MRGIKRILMVPVAAVLLLAGACTGNGLDNGDSAAVILEILNFTTPPVTAATTTGGTCASDPTVSCTVASDCPGVSDVCNQGVGSCTLTVVDWTVNLANVPKNSLADEPANDIAMIDVTISYPDFVGVNPRTFGLGGVVVPTGGTAVVTFPPIALQDTGGFLSMTGNLVMTLRGQTLEGTMIPLTVSRALTIEECV